MGSFIGAYCCFKIGEVDVKEVRYILLDSFPSLGADTLDNISRIVDECKIIFEIAFGKR